jgi:hypothetical protein
LQAFFAGAAGGFTAGVVEQSILEFGRSALFGTEVSAERILLSGAVGGGTGGVFAGVSGALPSFNKLDRLFNEASPSWGRNVGEIKGAIEKAEKYFRWIAKPGTIRRHPKIPGGYLAETVRGFPIGFRPISKSGPPTIDLGSLFKAGLSRWKKIKFT